MSQRVVEEEWKIVMNEEKLDELSDKNEITICEHLEDPDTNELLAYACLLKKGRSPSRTMVPPTVRFLLAR